MEIVSLEEVIRRYITLPTHASGTGWFPILCKVCNDTGKKGPRAGFKFDTEAVGYHCFNCSIKTKYDPETHANVPDKLVQVLRAFGVPEGEWEQVNFANLAKRDKGQIKTQPKASRTSFEPSVVPLPSHFYPLAEASPNDQWAEVTKAYLESRGIDHTSYSFMLSEKSRDPIVSKWYKRVIIPIYKDSNLIYYIGRDLTSKAQKKYLSPSYTKEKVMYGFTEVFRETDEPLYIVEGWFDAFAINGVAILGNEISEAQANWLNRSQRKKVYIPDRFGNGIQTAEQALKLKWSIATPGVNVWTEDVKDMSDAVNRYGNLFVMKSLAETTTSDPFVANMNLGMYCKHETTNDQNRSKEKNRTTSKT
jgi:hypothetical protein